MVRITVLSQSGGEFGQLHLSQYLGMMALTCHSSDLGKFKIVVMSKASFDKEQDPISKITRAQRALN
jgi:hypothetical protein